MIAVSQFKFHTHEEITSEFSEIVDDFFKGHVINELVISFNKKNHLLGLLHTDRVLLSVFHAEYFVVVGLLCHLKLSLLFQENIKLKKKHTTKTQTNERTPKINAASNN